MKAIDLST